MFGGIRVIAIYAQRLQQRGHDVVVVSTPWSPPGRRARAIVALQRWLQKVGPLEGAFQKPSHFDGVPVRHVQIKQNRSITDDDLPDADVVVATWWETAPWVAALSESKGAKAYFVQDYGAHQGQPMDAVARTWKLPLHKIAISRWLMGLIDAYTGDAEVDYVPNAVDLEQFRAPPRGKQATPTVGFLFNPAPQKGCEMIAQAIEIARRDIPDLQVISYGPGDPKTDMRLPEGTRHWQYAPESKLSEIYASCDAWLFGSWREGYGLPVLEAMACRTPVIGTPAGAAPELISEGGGLLVQRGDAHDMARAIKRMVALSESEWRAMSDAAHATASKYTWDEATDLFERALRQAIVKSKSNLLSHA